MEKESQLKGVWTGEGLAAVKRALGRVGHDFGNLLTPLMAYPGMIRAEIDPESKTAELLDVVERTADDMVRITKQMLELSLSDDFASRPFDLDDVVEVAVGNLRQDKPGGTETEVLLGGGPEDLDGGQDQVGQAVERLCRNGYEAMNDGGVLSVLTERVVLATQKPLSAGTLSPGKYAVVRVSDTGKGMDDDCLSHAFEPFFTTKRDYSKRGAGLGLTYAYLVADAHNGGVDVESTSPGGGTTVALYLRCGGDQEAAAPPLAELELQVDVESIPCAADHVLIVDDEGAVCKAVEGHSRHMLLMKPIRGQTLVNAIKARMES